MSTESTKPKFRVGMVARLTGLSTHVLRVWERRYAAVVPSRTPAGGRLYSDADVARLSLLAQLVDNGHSIGSIANLDDDELRGMARAALPQPTVPRDDSDGIRDAFLDALERFDTVSAQRILGRAAAGYEPRHLLLGVVAPMLHEIGQRWEDGRYRVAHEHAASHLLRNLLGSYTRLYGGPPTLPPIVVAAPEGDRHEFGALIAAMLLSIDGQNVIYLGADLPVDDISHVVTKTRAQGLVLSLTVGDTLTLTRHLNRLAQDIPEPAQIVVGGRATPESLPKRVTRLGTLDSLAKAFTPPS